MGGADRRMRGLDQRRFAHAARAPQQRIVRRQAAGEALGILDQKIAHPIDALEQRHVDPVDAANRRQLCPSGCQTKASAAAKSSAGGLGGASRSSASAIRASNAAASFCEGSARFCGSLACRPFWPPFCSSVGEIWPCLHRVAALSLSGARRRSQVRPERRRGVAIGPTAAIVRAILRAKTALHPGRRALMPPRTAASWRSYVHFARLRARRFCHRLFCHFQSPIWMVS